MLRGVDGWDLCQFEGAAIKYTYFANAAQGEVVAGRYAGRSFWIFNTGFGEANWTRIFDAQSTWWMGMNFRTLNEGGQVGTPVVTWYRVGNGSGSALQLRMNADQTMSVLQGSLGGSPNTLVRTTDHVFTLNDWGFLELKVSVSGGTCSYELWLDGSLMLGTGGVLTMAGSFPCTAASIDRFTHRWEALGARGINLDDYYILDTVAGDGMVDRLGPVRVTGLQVTADASKGNWTPSTGTTLTPVEADVPVPGGQSPDGDLTYMSPGSAADVALFNLFTSPCFGRVLAVVLNACGRKVTGSPTFDAVVRSRTGLHQIGSTQLAFATPGHYFNLPATMDDYFTYQKIMALSPDSGTYWTDREITTDAWGVRSTGSQRMTQIYLEKLTTLAAVPYDCGQASYGF